MMTVKQVAALTGVSVRTLQFYDEIGLLRPAGSTPAGYRLYDGAALEALHQILFLKELGFPLREIKALLAAPAFDRAAAFTRQREQLRRKRGQIDAQLQLLDKLLQGENCMEPKDFDMSAYFAMLEDLKQTHADAIVQRMGSLESFDEMIRTMKARQGSIAASAVELYGSLEQYTAAMKQNLTAFLQEGPPFSQEEALALAAKTEAITRRLTADLTLDPASPPVQAVTRQLVAFTEACNHGMDMGAHYWSYLAEAYCTAASSIQVTDRKYGPGASAFIGRALKAYLAGAGGAAQP